MSLIRHALTLAAWIIELRCGVPDRVNAGRAVSDHSEYYKGGLFQFIRRPWHREGKVMSRSAASIDVLVQQ